MNTKILLGVLVALVVVGGGGYYFMTQQAAPVQSGDQISQQPNEEEQDMQAGKYTGSIVDLAARGGSWKCSIDSSTAQAATSGTTYVSGSMVRADFVTNVQGYGSVQTHLIVNDGYSYTWSSMMSQGIKTKLIAQGQGGTSTSGAGSDANQSYSYNCEPWSADASFFVVPGDVTFRTF